MSVFGGFGDGERLDFEDLNLEVAIVSVVVLLMLVPLEICLV